MKLHYRLNADFKDSRPSIIFIHGLFGNLNNFNTLSKELNTKKYNTLQVDLRNHGQSPHSPVMNYKTMAKDILDLLNNLHIKTCIVIGHSMGGKVAMTLPMLATDRVIKIIIIDIAPTTYVANKHDNIFLAIDYVAKLRITSKNEAFILMNKFIHDQKIIIFLLKSFRRGQWIFNIASIQKNYSILNSWEKYKPWFGDILFIAGQYSPYVKYFHHADIYQQFPKSFIHIVQSGHWVHIEQKDSVVSIIDNFLLK